jgi:hypothetical protein
MWYRLRTFFNAHIAATVSDDMAACLDCGAIQCSTDKFVGCPYRQARAASLRAGEFSLSQGEWRDPAP